MFLRPCRAVAEHMVQLVTSEERLQFADVHAEQTFIEWCVALFSKGGNRSWGSWHHLLHAELLHVEVQKCGSCRSSKLWALGMPCIKVFEPAKQPATAELSGRPVRLRGVCARLSNWPR